MGVAFKEELNMAGSLFDDKTLDLENFGASKSRKTSVRSFKIILILRKKLHYFLSGY